MCPVKTENLALNVCRSEAAFWRRLATSVKGIRSRGDLQKNLLLAGLEKFNRAAARELRAIREMHSGRPIRGLIAAALVVVFCLSAFQHDVKRRRVPSFRPVTVRQEVAA